MVTTPPSLNLVSFDCPHCGSFAHQFWWHAHANPFYDGKTPSVWTKGEVEAAITSPKFAETLGAENMEDVVQRLRELGSGFVVFAPESDRYTRRADNVFFSRCHACDRIAVWIHDRLVFPVPHQAPIANPDLPPDIKADYDEAAQIVQMSPRGAAALLRLVIQRLLKYLGGGGKDLNEDIASLVSKGLDRRIQMSLDVVRVIGNNAVHPGQIELKDDRPTANTLFSLVNLIVDSMISQPKHIEATYKSLPATAHDQIEKRDKKK
jgi:hypothetical protein